MLAPAEGDNEKRRWRAGQRLPVTKNSPLPLIISNTLFPRSSVKEGYPDFTAFDPEDTHYDPKSKEDTPTWIMVDIKLKKKFKTPVALTEIKANSKLQSMRLVQRGNRLSVMPIEKKELDVILKMGGVSV